MFSSRLKDKARFSSSDKTYDEKLWTMFSVGRFRRDNLENLKQIQRKQSKENYNECFEVLRIRLLKENTNDYILLAHNSAHSMEMLKYIN